MEQIDLLNEAEIGLYQRIASGATGCFARERALIAVWGKEAVQFLNGMITNDVAALEDGGEMMAAFPNAKGRLLAVVRVLRRGERYLFDVEAANHAAVYQNLFRFTFAGDFFVADLSADYDFFDIFGTIPQIEGEMLKFAAGPVAGVFVPKGSSAKGEEVSPELFELLRIEAGLPLFGVDMDEATIVPELGLDGLISYNKGCYIGQEIIARIYFRGHVAKQLSRLVFDVAAAAGAGQELFSEEGKPAGKITSAIYSPIAGKTAALGYVRYEFLNNENKLINKDI